MIDQTRELYEEIDISGLTERQERAIAALLTHATVRDSAKAAQVSEATIYRWKKHDLAFSEALRAAQNDRMSMAVGFLHSTTAEALDTLREIMVDKNQPGTVRVSAAAKFVSFGLRTYYDLSEVDQLIERLRNEVEDFDE